MRKFAFVAQASSNRVVVVKEVRDRFEMRHAVDVIEALDQKRAVTLFNKIHTSRVWGKEVPKYDVWVN